MKSFKQLTEELSLNEVDLIGDVVSYLSSVKDTTYESKEEALGEVSTIIADLGLTFDMEEAIDILDSEDGNGEIPLKDIGGEEISLSVFAGESLESKVEGEMFLKVTSNFNEESNQFQLEPEIIVYFDDEESKSLSDIEFDVIDTMSDVDKVEEEDEDLKEEETEIEETPVETDDSSSVEQQKEEMPDDEFFSSVQNAVLVKIKELDLEKTEDEISNIVETVQTYILELLTPKDEVVKPTVVVNDDDDEEESEEENDVNSNVEIYEEMDLDDGLWNVVLMKPDTRLVISRLIKAKDSKELERILEQDYKEYIALSIDKVAVFDVDKMIQN